MEERADRFQMEKKQNVDLGLSKAINVPQPQLSPSNSPKFGEKKHSSLPFDESTQQFMSQERAGSDMKNSSHGVAISIQNFKFPAEFQEQNRHLVELNVNKMSPKVSSKNLL